MEALPQGWTFSYSSSELYTLASLLGGKMLIGIFDPFPGWLTEEIHEAIDEILRSLMTRGILVSCGDREVIMDMVTAALVGSLVAPQAVFIITLTQADYTFRQINVYHRTPLTIALELKEECWTLQLLPDAENIAHQVQKLWHLDHQAGVLSPPISFPESIIEEIREARSGGMAKILSCLTAAGISSESAQALAYTLATARQNGALLALNIRQGVWNTSGLGMLEGENGLWMLRSFYFQQVPWIECTPCSGEELMAEVINLINRFLPPREG